MHAAVLMMTPYDLSSSTQILGAKMYGGVSLPGIRVSLKALSLELSRYVGMMPTSISSQYPSQDRTSQLDTQGG